jgi:hypothetical protein
MDWIKTHVIMGSMAVITPVLLWGAKKYLPGLVKKYSDIFLSALVNPDITDPFIKEQVTVIIKAAMKIAEHTMGEKAGTDKMAWVVDYVCAKTSLKREDVQTIAQGIYDSIRQELADHAKDIPIAPAANNAVK